MSRRCISSFVTADNRAVAAGELVEDNDPVIEGREAFFAPLEVSVADAEKPTPATDNDTPPTTDEPVVPPTVDARAELREREEAAEAAERAERTADVEEATANPGERRNTRGAGKP